MYQQIYTSVWSKLTDKRWSPKKELWSSSAAVQSYTMKPSTEVLQTADFSTSLQLEVSLIAAFSIKKILCAALFPDKLGTKLRNKNMKLGF